MKHCCHQIQIVFPNFVAELTMFPVLAASKNMGIKLSSKQQKKAKYYKTSSTLVIAFKKPFPFPLQPYRTN